VSVTQDHPVDVAGAAAGAVRVLAAVVHATGTKVSYQELTILHFISIYEELTILHFFSLLVTKILTDLGQARHTVQADHVM
jgi:hypothetical protein